MIVKENITVYKCEHCTKKLFVKKAMELHEQWCNLNPDNFRICYECNHLERVNIEYEKDIQRLGANLGVIFDTETRKASGFKCTKLNLLLYPLKVEKKGLPDLYPETFDEQYPMKKECEHFKTKDIW